MYVKYFPSGLEEDWVGGEATEAQRKRPSGVEGGTSIGRTALFGFQAGEMLHNLVCSIALHSFTTK